MGIDGIGGKPPVGVGQGSLGPSNSTGEGFSLERNNGVAAPQASSDVSTEALNRFHAGELSLDEYMDTRVQKALAHLGDRLPLEQLGLLKQQLKEQMKSDPAIAVLVQRATGVSPSDAGLDDGG